MTPEEKASQRHSRFVFGGVVALVVACVLGSVAFAQAKLRQEALVHRLDLARSDARSLESFLTQGLKSTDLMLQSLAQADAVHALAPKGMVNVVRSTPLLRSISELDERGRIQISSTPANVGTWVDVQGFMPFSTEVLDMVRVGAAWAGRDLADGQLARGAVAGTLAPLGFVPVLRDVVDAHGRHHRLLASLNTDHLLGAYLERVSDEVSSVELFRYDGVLLLSTDPARSPGLREEHSEVMRRLERREVGEFDEVLPSGQQLLTAYRASGTYPLVTVVRYDRARSLQDWRNAALLQIGLAVLVLLVGGALALVYYRRMEQAARARWAANRQLRLTASVFTHAQEAIAITDLRGNILSVNQAFTRITGYTIAEVLGRNPRILSSGRQSADFYAAMWKTLAEKGYWEGEIWNRKKSGEVYAEMLNISAVPDEAGRPQNYVGIFLDITVQKNHQAQLERIAHYDALTGLPNRVLLADRLKQALAQAQRRGKLMGVVFLDLDGFKAVNDQHGHDVGDQLLVVLAQRLRDCLREPDTLARMGGDEFVAVLADLDNLEECHQVLERMLGTASQPIAVGALSLQVSASLGAALYPHDGTEADTLLRHADQAMYEAKQAGRNRYQLFDAEQDISTRRRVEGRASVAQALAGGQFVLYYQPKVNLRLGRVVGAEVLVRWLHPEQGLLPPARFLPDIEGHALSAQLGDWVLSAALDQLSDWMAGGLCMPLSVNISAHHLQQPHFVPRLRQLLQTHPRVRPGDLELEVLETSALDDLARVSMIMRDCEALGVHFALDDFGTGYSSLTYLKRLPASVLKIDQSFVRDMLTNGDDLAIVQGVIGLCEAFHRTVIAEGVETAAHGDMLLRLGCDLVQGYGVARPMPASALPDWVQAWEAQPGWTSF